MPERQTPLGDRTVGDVAMRLPGAAALLRRVGIRPCCCAADLTVAAAAAKNGIPAAGLVEAIRDRAAAATRGAPQATGALIDHLVARYHVRHRVDLPGLIARAGEAERAGSGREPPVGLAELLDGLRAALEEHMLKEELRVFPLMRGGREDRLAASLELMREEHADNALFLLQAEHLTGGYRAPPDAPPGLDRLYADLARFAEDLVAHVFLEERALFPRFEVDGPTAATLPQRS